MPHDTTPSTISAAVPTSEGGWTRSGRKRMSVRTRMILHMQLRGFRVPEIAQQLGLRERNIANLVSSRRYQAALDAKLNEVDDEFLRMKPLAVRAVRNGLESRDEGIGLKAAEQWFRAHGFKGFGSGQTNITVNVTAEDVAVQLLNKTVERRTDPGTGDKSRDQSG